MGFWLKGLPKLKKALLMKLPHKERHRHHWLPPSKDRWKIRSTAQGIADMAGQWGGSILMNKEVIQYINSLLAEGKLLDERKDDSKDYELDFRCRNRKQELGIIYPKNPWIQ